MWGVIALPLRSMLYVREVDVPKLAEKYDWQFRTKHQLRVALLTWFMKASARCVRNISGDFARRMAMPSVHLIEQTIHVQRSATGQRWRTDMFAARRVHRRRSRFRG